MSRDLVNNAVLKEGELTISQRRGIITVVPKEDSGLSDLSNWRPITLDYKIASKVIAKRIENLLLHKHLIPGFLLLLKNHIFIARSEDTIFISHM